MIRLLQAPTPDPQAKEQSVIQTHYLMMVIVWLAAGNIGLWSQAFKQYKCANCVHLVCMGIITIITWMSGFLAIIYFGTDNQAGDFHTKLGIAILAIISFQAIMGIISIFLQKSSRVRSDIIPWTNILHRLLGYICFILIQVQILYIFYQNQPTDFMIIIVISLVSYVSFLLYKILKPGMKKYTAISQQSDANLQLVKNQRDLAKFNGEYFIFVDKVYDINKVLTNHPRGFEIINQVRKRQVDRFLYGSESIQSLEHTKVHCHSASSITLAGQPIGIMEHINPYKYMDEINDVSVEKIVQPCKSEDMYAVYVTSTSSFEPFEYSGFSDLSQLGKYLAVTMNGRKTRLYSIVNFLQQKNISLMNLVFGKVFTQKLLERFGSNLSELMDVKYSSHATTSQPILTLPLLIKKYDNGQFTKVFLQGIFKGDVKISRPRGRGLMLHDIVPANKLFYEYINYQKTF